MTGLRYVYAVCRPFGSALQRQLTGVAGSPPKQLTHHGLIAVVSTVPEADFAEEPLRAHLEDLDWLTATARAHQQVIDALTVVTTPLPLRLATVFRDDSGVRTMMEAREDDFRRVLDRLEGRVEWGVKVYAEPEPTEAAQPTEPARPEEGLLCRDATICVGAVRRPGPERTCGRRPPHSPADSTKHFPRSPRIPGCTPRRAPRFPVRPDRTCSMPPIWCRAPFPRNSWNWWTGRRTTPPESG